MRRGSCFHAALRACRPVAWACVAAALPAAHAADPFLDTIRQEVGAVQLDPASQHSITGRIPATDPAPPPAPVTGSASESRADMPAGLSRADFEDYLRRRYFGSYAFYRKLRPDRQQQIFQAYSERPDIRYIRERIKQSYLNP